MDGAFLTKDILYIIITKHLVYQKEALYIINSCKKMRSCFTYTRRRRAVLQYNLNYDRPLDRRFPPLGDIKQGRTNCPFCGIVVQIRKMYNHLMGRCITSTWNGYMKCCNSTLFEIAKECEKNLFEFDQVEFKRLALASEPKAPIFKTCSCGVVTSSNCKDTHRCIMKTVFCVRCKRDVLLLNQRHMCKQWYGLKERALRYHAYLAECCMQCYFPFKKIKVCSACRKVTYCSQECQRKHWKWHKHYCRLNRKSKI